MASSADEIDNVNLRKSYDEEDISLLSDFCVFICESSMQLLDLKDDEIQCRTVEKANNVEEYVKYVEHMKHIHKYVFGTPRKDPLKRDFVETIHYFHTTQPKKRLFCRSKDYYLVKKSFTEGVQYVKQGEIHTYKAIARPLDIYISYFELKPKTFKHNYDAYTTLERILPGKTKIIPSNTYYIVIAPCHAYFKKVTVNRPEDENSTEISPEADLQATNFAEAKELSFLYKDMRISSQPSGSRDEEYGNPIHFKELERKNDPEIVNDDSSSSSRSFESAGQSTRVKSVNLHSHREATSQKKVTFVSSSPNFAEAKELSFLYKDMRISSQPSGSRDEEYGNPSHFKELERENDPEIVNDDSSSSSRSFEGAGQSTRVKSVNLHSHRETTSRKKVTFVSSSPKILRNERERIRNNQAIKGTSLGNQRRAVFAIRKDSNVESYSLRSDSTFRIILDDILAGSFAIENNNMDPNVIEYRGDGQFICEIARFKNGSTFETTLTIEEGLLNKLRSTKKKESVIVNYFFKFAFKTVEATYKKFFEMRNVELIGSCVPAIVPLSDSVFCGAVSDVYDAKP